MDGKTGRPSKLTAEIQAEALRHREADDPGRPGDEWVDHRRFNENTLLTQLVEELIWT
jgi:hypothetical protein